MYFFFTYGLGFQPAIFRCKEFADTLAEKQGKHVVILVSTR